ncbi:MAG: radical SAM protein, partial [Candidatus Helarchaeota archaeon]|nr:radical SAM protein [Candidatus Helarchaeota archaeon]
MSDYNGNPVEPFFSGAISHRAFFFSLITRIPPVPSFEDGRAKIVPYGLRKIEAALLNNGFDENDIVIIHPKYLKRFLGPNTKIVGITSMDPVGMTYCDRTFTALVGFGDESRNAYAFRKLLHNKLFRKYSPKIVVGGAGAWQVRGKKMRQYFGIDHVIIGEGDITVPKIFKKILKNEPVPAVIKTESPQKDSEIPLIRGAAVFGTVEISRGCGRGCKFCTPNRR